MSTLPVWVEDVINKIEGISIAGRSLNLSTVQKSILEFLKSIPSADNVKNITSALAGLFGSLSLLLTAFISSIYLVSEHDQMLDVLLLRISTKEKKNIRETIGIEQVTDHRHHSPLESERSQPAFQQRNSFIHPPKVINAAGTHSSMSKLLYYSKIAVFVGHDLA